MSLATLKDDLLQEFREERIMINEQMEILDPLATTLRKPAAQRLLSSSALILAEYGCYSISIGGIASLMFMHRIYPFSLLSDIFYNSELRNRIGGPNLFYLIAAIYGVGALCAILIFILGRVARQMRLKNDILQLAGKDIKTIVGQHLARKAVLDTIEQRHMLGLSGISQPEKNRAVEIPATPHRVQNAYAPVNEIRNPGFG